MRRLLVFLFLGIVASPLPSEEVFKVIVLGCQGGPKENNLSGYLFAPKTANDFIALDAGSLLHGIYLAHQKKSFYDITVNPETPWNFEAEILRTHVTGYFISHAHLDHVAGLIINSQMDTKKSIFGIDSTIDFLRDYLFNWKIWPNFGSEGDKPLHQYHYQRLKPSETTAVSTMRVTPYLLSHPDSYASTAFLMEYQDVYILYLGDTSPDALESTKHLEPLWKHIAPLIQQNKLRALFIECSYDDQKPSSELFGHLTPHYLTEELTKLARLVNPTEPQLALRNLNVVVTHIKEGLLKGPTSVQKIREELEKRNTLHVPFIFPEQGQRLEF